MNPNLRNFDFFFKISNKRKEDIIASIRVQARVWGEKGVEVSLRYCIG